MGLLDWLGLGRRPPAIDPALWQNTLASLPFLACLSEDEQARLKTLSEGFLASKEFSAGGGLELSDAMCVAIAAQGCLPILNLGLSAYAGWVGIIVYPDEFEVERRLEDDSGVVHEFTDTLSGEAWEGGPLVLSWHDVTLAGEGYNVVIHEFAHKLDMLNGAPDGIPALHSGLTEDGWIEVFDAAYADFCERVDQGEDTFIDPYASSDEAEFFAVMSEAFFDQPARLKDEYPNLYDLFCRYYRQDPLARLPSQPAQRPDQ